MKKLIPFIVFFLISCSEDNKPSSKILNGDLDSLLNNNTNTIQISNRVQKSSDSATQKKVVKIVKEIQYLTNFVEVLKVENRYLTRELKVSKENFRVDTVFIETKKNFWGKEKTTINVRTDSTELENTDSIFIVN